MSCLYNNPGSSCASAFSKCASCPHHMDSMTKASGVSKGEPVKEWLEDVGAGIGKVLGEGTKTTPKPKKKPVPKKPAQSSGSSDFNPLKSAGVLALVFLGAVWFGWEDEEPSNISGSAPQGQSDQRAPDNQSVLSSGRYYEWPQPDLNDEKMARAMSNSLYIKLRHTDDYLATYKGQVNDNVPHGYGALTVTDFKGSLYTLKAKFDNGFIVSEEVGRLYACCSLDGDPNAVEYISGGWRGNVNKFRPENIYKGVARYNNGIFRSVTFEGNGKINYSDTCFRVYFDRKGQELGRRVPVKCDGLYKTITTLPSFPEPTLENAYIPIRGYREPRFDKMLRDAIAEAKKAPLRYTVTDNQYSYEYRGEVQDGLPHGEGFVIAHNKNINATGIEYIFQARFEEGRIGGVGKKFIFDPRSEFVLTWGLMETTGDYDDKRKNIISFDFEKGVYGTLKRDADGVETSYEITEDGEWKIDSNCWKFFASRESNQKEWVGTPVACPDHF